MVAIKCVEKSSLTKSATENLLTEIGLLKKLKHEYVVEMKDFQWDDQYIFIIMEYCSGGDLSKFIRLSRTLPEVIVRRFLQQLAQALHYLRTQNVCHMDLKPQNILLSSEKDPVLKLADFGFAQYLRSEEDAKSLRGSPLYMAPEMLLSQSYDARVDLWSVGIILYECLFGHAPYSSKSFTELVEKLKNPRPIELPYGVNISSSCRDLLTRLLKRDPDLRLSYDDFFQHEFLDLEHAPSSLCYPKAVKLFIDAVKFDQIKDYPHALRAYREALQYFVAAIQFEKNATKKEMMRQRAKEYLERAEYLRKQVRLKQLSATANGQSSYQDLVKMSNDLPQLQSALVVARAAEQSEEKDRLEEALQKYQLALEALLPILADEPKGRRRELLSIQVQKWISNAESLQSFMSMKALPVPDEVNDTVTTVSDEIVGSSSRPCCLQ